MPNLNAEAHFSQSPLGVDIKRSVFNRSFNHKMTFNPGVLNCLMADEILPGDDVAVKVSDLVRAATPLVPVADDCFLDFFAFFEPYRLDWPHFKEMNGENNASDWYQPYPFTVPTLPAFGSHRSVGDLGHQMGIPPLTTSSNKAYAQVHVLEMRGYRRIWNDWLRDQNTQAPKLINTGDTETELSLFQLLPVDRIHDYFGSCLPGTQKSAQAVTIALTGFAPVRTVAAVASQANAEPLAWSNRVTGASQNANGNILLNSGSTAIFNQATVSSSNDIVPRNLFADLSQSPLGAKIGIDVNVLRLAVQTQRILEKLAIGGEKPVAA